MIIVETQNLTVTFDKFVVLDKINLKIAKGDFVTLVGPSGCGKSTLLRVISGVIPGMIKAGVEGRVQVIGQRPEDLVAGALDIVLQETTLFPWRTSLENLRLGLELLKNNRSTRELKTLLSSVGLQGFEDSFPHELSGGMKQRVAFMSALVTEPQILLMDEPLGALDALTREEMWSLLERIHQQKPETTIIFVTHHIEEAVVLGDKVVVMRGRPGKIAKEIKINIPRPRVGFKGVIVPKCLEIANIIRELIHEKEEEDD